MRRVSVYGRQRTHANQPMVANPKIIWRSLNTGSGSRVDFRHDNKSPNSWRVWLPELKPSRSLTTQSNQNPIRQSRRRFDRPCHFGDRTTTASNRYRFLETQYRRRGRRAWKTRWSESRHRILDTSARQESTTVLVANQFGSVALIAGKPKTGPAELGPPFGRLRCWARDDEHGLHD